MSKSLKSIVLYPLKYFSLIYEETFILMSWDWSKIQAFEESWLLLLSEALLSERVRPFPLFHRFPLLFQRFRPPILFGQVLAHFGTAHNSPFGICNLSEKLIEILVIWSLQLKVCHKIWGDASQLLKRVQATALHSWEVYWPMWVGDAQFWLVKVLKRLPTGVPIETFSNRVFQHIPSIPHWFRSTTIRFPKYSHMFGCFSTLVIIGALKKEESLAFYK